jgi:hypothetical protein
LRSAASLGTDATSGTSTRANGRSEWVKVWTDDSALDGAIHQPLNSSVNEIAGCFKQLRGATDKRIQDWGDDLLRQQAINHEQKLTLRHESI